MAAMWGLALRRFRDHMKGQIEMTPSPEPTTAAAVTPVRRAPVRASTLVRSDAAHTFDTFVRTIGAWWPVDPFSAGRDRVHDGTVVSWGEITAWDPPAGFTLTWTGTPVPTEVELTFNELGPNLTRVALEHRGWDAMTEAQLAEDCALPGGYTGGAYSTGWERILDAFARTFA